MKHARVRLYQEKRGRRRANMYRRSISTSRCCTRRRMATASASRTRRWFLRRHASTQPRALTAVSSRGRTLLLAETRRPTSGGTAARFASASPSSALVAVFLGIPRGLDPNCAHSAVSSRKLFARPPLLAHERVYAGGRGYRAQRGGWNLVVAFRRPRIFREDTWEVRGRAAGQVSVTQPGYPGPGGRIVMARDISNCPASRVRASQQGPAWEGLLIRKQGCSLFVRSGTNLGIRTRLSPLALDLQRPERGAARTRARITSC